MCRVSSFRDLTPSQRAMIGARATALREKIAADMKERQRAATVKGNKTRHETPVVEPVPQLADADATKTRDQIGKLVGVAGRMIDYGVKVIDRGARRERFPRTADDGGNGGDRQAARSP